MCDFTLHHYVDTVSEYKKAGYKLIQVKDLHNINDDDKYLLIRHDVDLSPRAAEMLAVQEYVNNIKASYYILLYSPIYNTLSPDNIAHIRQISKYEHQVGLHVDSRYENSWTSVGDDMRTLSHMIGKGVNTFTQHFRSTTPEIKFPAYTDGYWDVVNAGFKYLSDSSMNWREGCFCKYVDKHKRLIVLVHPEWHIFEGKRGQIIERARDIEISRVARETQQWIDIQVDYLKKFNKIGINA